MDCCSMYFCFKDPRRAFVAIGLLTMLQSMTQILITIAEFTGKWADNTILFTQSSFVARTVYELYIVLSVMDFILLIFSLVLLCGNERTNEARAKSYFMPWIILIPFYIIYESAINIYYFYNQYNGAFPKPDPLSYGQGGFAIVPIIYWVIKDILLIYGWMFIALHFQHYCPCRPVQYHSSAPTVAAPGAGFGNSVYYQGTAVTTHASSCKTCGAQISGSQSPMTTPSCGCNNGFKMMQQTPMIQAPAMRYSQYVDVLPKPAYGIGNQMGAISNRASGWTSSAYNGIANRIN